MTKDSSQPSGVRRSLMRGLATAIVLAIYGLGMIGLSGLAMTAGTTAEAQAWHGGWHRGRGRGRGWGRGRGRGRGWGRGRGRGRGWGRGRGRGRGWGRGRGRGRGVIWLR